MAYSSSRNSNSSSGTTTAQTQTPNSGLGSGFEDELRQIQRKRKRMESNRESARRSRMRKQKHLDELMAQVGQFKEDNTQIVASIRIKMQRLVSLEAENSILRAQMVELSHRLQSLNDILGYINNSSMSSVYDVDGLHGHDHGLDHYHHHHHHHHVHANNDNLMDPFLVNLASANYQPIMAASDVLQY